ncbi:MAG TPA: protein kinase [Gemmatimonadaceae bacterium]|nr:protein kinase [Gemmatimonadaceae bacterium]
MSEPVPDQLSAKLQPSLDGGYRIERELGAGGMATVYLAEDLKHHRKVAIKVLHPELSAVLGPERFLKEIELTANLQHPHILPLFDSGSASGLLYYIMPYVDGETLRARLEREGQLPIVDALRIACEAADALQYAHDRGVVHRDIKPENILLQNGHALVADFGIALAVEQAGGVRMTQTGLSLGTPHYMAPEQAMGDKHIGPRADVYALGAVTYEMLAGEPPFTGPNSQAIVAKVITEEAPSLSTHRRSVSPGVDVAVARALQKLPADRWQTASKFAEALMAPDMGASVAGAGGSRVASAPQRAPSAKPRAIAAAVGCAAVIALAAAWWLGRRSAAPEAPWSEFTQLTDASGVETSPSLSPDGESFAYASDASGRSAIYVQRVGGRNPVAVAGDSMADYVWPAYSPDGKEIAYAKRGEGIFVVGATGESPRRLTTFGTNPAWSPDGRSIVFGSEEVFSPYAVNNTGELWIVESHGGTPRRLDPHLAGTVYQPAWSPSGKRIAFWSAVGGQRDIATMPAGGGASVKLTNDAAVDWAPTWSPDGRYVYFASDRGGTMGIWRIPVNESSGAARGAPEFVAAGADGGMDLPGLSRDGSTLVFRSELHSVNPAAVEFDAAAGRITSTTLLQHRTGNLVPTDVSPDGKWLALYNRLERQQDIFVMRTDGSGLARLTDDAARDWVPRFTPDGAGVTFYSNKSGAYDAWMIQLDGSERTRLTDFAGGVTYAMLAPDGRHLVTASQSDPTKAWIAAAPWPATKRTATAVKPLDHSGVAGQPNYWTRDGRWLLGLVSTPNGDTRGAVLWDPATLSPRLLNDDSESEIIAWLPDHQHIVYFNQHGALVMQDITTLARRELTGTLPYPPDVSAAIVASPDGRTLYYGALQEEANIWMMRRPGGEKITR